MAMLDFRNRVSAMMPPQSHVGIVLAAGGSRRLGFAKQLLRVQGRSLIARSTEFLIGTGARRVLVILGAEAARMQQELAELQVSILINYDWQTGLAGTLRLAADAVATIGGADCLLTGVDQPLLDQLHLQQLLEASRTYPGHDIVTGYGGVRGTPVLLRGQTLALARTIVGDRGLQQVLKDRKTHVVVNERLVEDLDTPEAVERARLMGWID